MLIASQKMTAIEFLESPEDPDNARYELAHGEVIVSASPNLSHGRVVTVLMSLLYHHIEQHNLGMIFSNLDSYFSPEDVRRPDLFYFKASRVHLLENKPLLESPDLCVEVLSPSNRQTDTGDKFKLYESARVLDYWIVDPINKSMEAYNLQRGRYVLSGKGHANDVLRVPPFTAIEIPLAKLWWPESPSRS